MIHVHIRYIVAENPILQTDASYLVILKMMWGQECTGTEAVRKDQKIFYNFSKNY